MFRKWISIFALWGILLHAGMLVRHNAVMLDAHLVHGALVNDLKVICASQGMAQSNADSLPHIPPPSDTQMACPVCSGLTSAFALEPPIAPHVAIQFAWQYRTAIDQGASVETTWPARLPPARAPPLA